MELLSDITIPDHELIKRVSRTGMSSVYLAQDLKNNREVVLKILEFDPEDESDSKMIKRFFQEYVLLRHLKHKNIASIYNRYICENYTCIAMEFFPYGDLSKQIRKKLTTQQAVNYLIQIATGLQTVHREKIIHRDLKPKNILFRKDKSLAISDFGIAKVMEKSYGLTLQGIILGTPYYMSPEQIDNTVIDHRTDLYSLGVIFYEMLTGQKPYRGNSLMKIFCAHLSDPIPSLPFAQQDYQPILDRLLAKKPDDRFRNISDLLDCLPDENPASKGEETADVDMLELIMA